MGLTETTTVYFFGFTKGAEPPLSFSNMAKLFLKLMLVLSVAIISIYNKSNTVIFRLGFEDKLMKY